MKIKLAVITLLSTLLFGFTQYKNNVIETPLEAVLIVGNTQESTASAIKDMNKLALIFQNNRIKVTKFYNINLSMVKTVIKKIPSFKSYNIACVAKPCFNTKSFYGLFEKRNLVF